LTRLSAFCSAVVVILPTLPKREDNQQADQRNDHRRHRHCGGINLCAKLTSDD